MDTKPITVECPICHQLIEIPQYDEVSRSDALTKHIEKEHTGWIAKLKGGNPMTPDEISQIATKTADEVMERISEQGQDSLMLHSVPYLHGSPGIVVNEEKASRSPCKCVEYKPGKRLAWSPGIIGALTDEQEKLYCPTMVEVERPGTVSRMEKWQEAVDTCKAEISKIPGEEGEERMTTWMRCMSRELKARGIET